MSTEPLSRLRSDLPLIALMIVPGIILFLPIFVRIYWPAADWLDVTGHAIGRDFINVWAGGRLAFGGAFDALFDAAAFTQGLRREFGAPLPDHAWSYPLYVLPLYWPFAQLPYPAALAAWTVTFLAAYVAVAVAPLSPERRLLGGILITLAPASIVNTVGGQNGFLTAALLLAGVLYADRRPIVAGVCIGLLAIKPQLGLCLPFVLIAIGAWRTFAVAALTVATLAVGSVAWFGIDTWQTYFKVAGALQLLLLEAFNGFYTSMMVSITAGLRTLGTAYPAAMTIQAIVSVSVLVVTVICVRKTRDAVERTALVAAATPLMTPYAFNYDLTALSAAIAWLIVRGQPDGTPARAVLIGAWLVPVAVMLPALRNLFAAQALLLAAFVIIAHHVAVRRTSTRTEHGTANALATT